MQQIGKYQLQGVLGQGGMGVVYRSFHPHLNRPVAIKLILTGGADAEARQRFLREAQVVAGLSHPNIIRIFDVDVQDDQPYLVMELVEGGSLAGRMGQPLTPEQVVALAIPLAQALDYAHSQGIVHRDLKPANVLLRADGAPVLADFGLARAASPLPDQRITATGAVLGTVAYMAPEQLSSRPLDGRTDIYALGVLLFEALTGQLPFLGDTGQMLLGHLQMPPPAPVTLNTAIPAELSRLVLWMLAKSPDDRPQRAAEVAETLQAIRARQVSTVRAPDSGLPPKEVKTTALPTIAVAQPGLTVAAPSGPAAPAGGIRLPPLLIGALLVGVFAAAVLGLGGLVQLARGGGTSAAGPTPALLRSPTAEVQGLEVAPTAAFQTEPTSLPEPTEVPARPLEPLEAAPMAGAESVGPEQFSVSALTEAETSGALWFFGEVRNEGAEPRERVAVRINLLDHNGKEVGSKVGYAERSYLAPDEVSPFSVLFSDNDGPIPEFESYAVEVRSAELSSSPGFYLRTLALEDVRTAIGSFGSQVVSGKLRNSGKEPVAFPQVIITFYDADGKVVGTQNTFAETDDTKALEPGASGRFEISWQIFSGQPASYLMVVQGQQPR
jgi:serine/threonine-protein kinase